MSVPTRCKLQTTSYTWHIKEFSEKMFKFYEESCSDDRIHGSLGLRSHNFVLSWSNTDGTVTDSNAFMYLMRRVNKDIRTNEMTPASHSFWLTLGFVPRSSAPSPNVDASQQQNDDSINRYLCFAWISGCKEQQYKSRLNAAGFLPENSPKHFVFTNWKFVSYKDLFDKSKGLVCNGELTIVCEVNALTSKVSCINSSLFDPLLPMVVPQSEHACSLVSDLKEIQESGVNSDVTLVAADGRKFPAHVAILSSRSPVFAAMFLHNMEEKQLGQINIEDVSSEAIKGLLKFIYTDVISPDITMAVELFVAADKYGISKLKELCEEAMVAGLNKDNAAEFFLLADRHHATELRSAAKRFTATHLKEISPVGGYQKWMSDNQQLAAEILQEMAELMAELTSSSWLQGPRATVSQ